MSKVGLLGGALLLVSGCKGGEAGQVTAQSAAIAEAQAGVSVAMSQAAAALAAASAPRPRTATDERLALAAMPEIYLKTSDVKSDEKAAINHYLQMTSVTVSNTSHFSVSDLQGTVTWASTSGMSVASSPFSLTGSILPGETKTFSTTAGTLRSPGAQGVAAQSSISFRRVAIAN
jgi:hypothetical protein